MPEISKKKVHTGPIPREYYQGFQEANSEFAPLAVREKASLFSGEEKDEEDIAGARRKISGADHEGQVKAAQELHDLIWNTTLSFMHAHREQSKMISMVMDAEASYKIVDNGQNVEFYELDTDGQEVVIGKLPMRVAQAARRAGNSARSGVLIDSFLKSSRAVRKSIVQEASKRRAAIIKLSDITDIAPNENSQQLEITTVFADSLSKKVNDINLVYLDAAKKRVGEKLPFLRRAFRWADISASGAATSLAIKTKNLVGKVSESVADHIPSRVTLTNFTQFYFATGEMGRALQAADDLIVAADLQLIGNLESHIREVASLEIQLKEMIESINPGEGDVLASLLSRVHLAVLAEKQAQLALKADQAKMARLQSMNENTLPASASSLHSRALAQRVKDAAKVKAEALAALAHSARAISGQEETVMSLMKDYLAEVAGAVSAIQRWDDVLDFVEAAAVGFTTDAIMDLTRANALANSKMQIEQAIMERTTMRELANGWKRKDLIERYKLDKVSIIAEIIALVDSNNINLSEMIVGGVGRVDKNNLNTMTEEQLDELRVKLCVMCNLQIDVDTDMFKVDVSSDSANPKKKR